MARITTTVVALKTISLALGGLITYLAFKAYRRTRSPSLRSLSVGFGLVTLGSLLAGIADQALGQDATAALIIHSALTAVGFAVIVHSLYAE